MGWDGRRGLACVYRYICMLVGRPLGDGGAPSLRAGLCWTLLDLHVWPQAASIMQRIQARLGTGTRRKSLGAGKAACPANWMWARATGLSCGKGMCLSSTWMLCDEMNLQLPSAHVCHLQLQSSTGTRITKSDQGPQSSRGHAWQHYNQHDTCINTRTAAVPGRCRQKTTTTAASAKT